MATIESPTVLDKIFDLTPGDPVTLRCQTTTSDIYYHGPPEYGRTPFTPEESHLRAIPYTIQGKFLGIEQGDEADSIAYVVLSRGSGPRPTIQHVPILAIVKPITH